MAGRRAVTETLEQGDDEGRPPSDEGLFARFVDWYAERPPTRHPREIALAVLIATVLAAGVAAAVQHEPPPPLLPAEVLAERERAAQRTARFAASILCDEREDVVAAITRHDRDWSSARVRVFVAARTPRAGELVVDVQPGELVLAYRVVSASGTCRRN